MDRYEFLSLTGLSFLGAIFFSSKNKRQPIMQTDCNDPITPPVPEGPFYKNEKLNRIDITEHKKGVPIDYLIKVEDKDCKPIEGAIVDIWQCDTEGIYSDFKQENTLNETWLRGYQITGRDGMCRFKSIFPGWYTGRVTHVHAKVYLKNKNVLTTNFFFTKDIENQVYKNPLYPKGPNPETIKEDIELRVDKDSVRHDTLLMDVSSDKAGNLTAKYKIALA
jgi:protocatechuate 3,4-dioxygenase beta subunit